MPVNRQFSRSLIASRDPRSLGRYEVNGPDDIQQTDAPVAWESPESKFTSFLRNLGKDIGIGPQELVQAAPMVMGPVIRNRADALKIWNTMIQNAGTGTTAEDLPVHFMRAAYPTMRRLVAEDIDLGRTAYYTGPGGKDVPLYGGFTPTEIPMRDIYKRGGIDIRPGAIIPEGSLEIHKLPEHIKPANVIGHELTHAVQQRRDPIGLNTSYIPYEVDPKRYYNQSWEVLARQGGATAQAKFEKFKQLLGLK